MFTKKLIVRAVCIANLIALPAVAEVYSTRNFAMGGAGVASSDYGSAAGSNGALLTHFEDGDSVAWTMPAVGLEASDKDSVIDTLDDIPDIYDDLEFNIDTGNTPGAIGNAEEIIQKLEDVAGSPVRLNAAALAGFARPSKDLAIAFDVRTSGEAGAVADYASSDKLILIEAIASGDSSLLDSTESSGYALGAAVTEAALTVAHRFSIGDSQALSLSVTPKYQRVDTMIYAVNAQDYDSGNFEDNINDDNGFNVDVGLAYSIGNNWVLGLNARNLIAADYDTEVELLGDRSFQGTYQIEPTAVAGVAYRGEMFTATVEGDLIKSKGFEILGETQFIRAGVEVRTSDWFQLRGGYRYDMEDTRANVFTAGVALSPGDVFNLELSGSYGDDDTYGAALDFNWKF